MVLPFEPMTMTFKDVHYYVEIPKVGFCCKAVWQAGTGLAHQSLWQCNAFQLAGQP